LRRPRSDFAIPRKLNFGLATIDVRKVTRAEMREVCDLDPDDVEPEGAWVDEDDTIYLGAWLTGPRLRRVFWHEVKHCLVDLDWHSVDTP
jgi:hypothetical protein